METNIKGKQPKCTSRVTPLVKPLSCVIALSIVVSVTPAVHAQTVFNTSAAPRGLTNLAPPSQMSDAFLGQDKKGPYVLSYRNFLFGPGQPVWVTVDNVPQRTTTYVLDTATGEVTFDRVIKRTEVIRISYGYYPESSQRNANPSQAAPLTFRLAALGMGNLNMTTFTGGTGDNMPRLVLGYAGKQNVMGGGLSTDFYYAPETAAPGGVAGKSAAENLAGVKLGYKGGTAKSGIDVGFQRGGKQFAPQFGKTFGMTDALQALNVGGRLAPSNNASLSFNHSDSRNLNGPNGTLADIAALKLGGGKGQPTLNLAYNDTSTTDVKGVTTGSSGRSAALGQQFGALGLAYKNTRNETLTGKNTTATANETLSFALAQADKQGRPGLGFNRSNDETTDAAGKITRSVTDKSSFGTVLGGVGLQLNTAQTDTILPDGRKAQADQRNFGLNLPTRKNGLMAFAANRAEDERLDAAGNRSLTATDKGNIAGSLGRSAFSYNVNRTGTLAGNKSTLGNEQETAAFSLPGGKGQPALLGFNRNDDIKRNDKGVLVGAANDVSQLNTKIAGGALGFQNTVNETYTPDGKKTAADRSRLQFGFAGNAKRGTPSLGLLQTSDTVVDPAGNKTVVDATQTNLGGRLGTSDFTVQSLRSNTLGANKATTVVDQQKVGFVVPVSMLKGAPKLKLGRTDQSTYVGDKRIDTDTNEIGFSGAIGGAKIAADITRMDALGTDGKTAFSDKQALQFNYGGGKLPGLSFNRGGDVKTDANGIRIGTMTDTTNFSTKVGVLDFSSNLLQTDVATVDRRRVITDTNTSQLRYGGAKGQPSLALKRTDGTRQLQDGSAFALTTDQLDLGQHIGNAKLAYQFQRTDGESGKKSNAGDLQTVGLQVAPRKNMPVGLNVTRSQGDFVDDAANKTGIVLDKVDVSSKFGTANVKAAVGQTATTKEDAKAGGLSRDTAVTLQTPIWGRGQNAAVTVSNFNNQTGYALENRNGFQVSFNPIKGLTLANEQSTGIITPVGAAAPSRNVATTKTTAELVPAPGTKLQSSVQSLTDGQKQVDTTDVAAMLGGQKTLFQVDGLLRMRDANMGDAAANRDSANANIALRPFKGVTVRGSYILNPDDPAQKDKFNPLEKREYGISAKLGAFELGGTYADTELLKGTPADVIAKAGGAPQFGEAGLTLGWRFGSGTQLTGGFKDTFAYGPSINKGLATYSLGFTHNISNSFNFSLSGSMINNRAITSPNGRNDYRAEAKLGVKF